MNKNIMYEITVKCLYAEDKADNDKFLKYLIQSKGKKIIEKIIFIILLERTYNIYTNTLFNKSIDTKRNKRSLNVGGMLCI